MADYAPTAANVLKSANGKTKDSTAAVAIAAGDLLYKLVDGTVGLHDANGVAPANVAEGIALNSAPGVGQPVRYCYDDPLFAPGFSLTEGATVIGSGTAGKMAPDADKVTGWTLNEIGHGVGSNKLALKITNSGAVLP
jgi:hypothetical protein